MNPPPRAQCVAVGHCVPERILDNAQLEEMVETSDEWIVSRTGIRQRRIVGEGQLLSHLALASAHNCLAQAGCAAAEIDGIIVATTTGDQTMPAVANVVQHQLGAHKAWGFDLINACNGFLAGLASATSFIESGRAQNILLISGDVMSPYIDYSDRNTCVLFGDGCGAVLLRAGPADGPGVIDFLMASDGSGAEALIIPSSGSALRPNAEVLSRGDQYLKQDGPRVFHQAVRCMTASSKQLLKRNGLSVADIDLFVPHQANQRIMASVGERLGLREGQLMSNIERYGNTTAGTVPLALADAHAAGRLRPGSRLLITTFGAGFAWGAAYLVWGAA